MPNEDAFLRSIAEMPEDDAPRLVYADWLEERGDPRGEFIRLKAEIARAAPHSEQYWVLRARLKSLSQLIDPGWATVMGYQPRHRPLFAKLPEHRQDRWRLVEEFIDVWHRPLESGDGYSETEIEAAEDRLGHRLPAALREWYMLAGRRGDVWSVQDTLQTPERISIRRDALIFRTENQSCELWGVRETDLESDDPPVIEFEAGVQASPTVSAFACLVLLYEAMFAQGVVWAGAEIADEQLLAKAVRGLSRCDLPDRHWVMSPIRIFEGTDLIVQCHAQHWLYVAARGELAFQQLDAEVRSRLEIYRT